MTTLFIVFASIFSYLAPGVFIGRRAYAAMYRALDSYDRRDMFEVNMRKLGAFVAMLFWPMTAVFIVLTINPPMNNEEKAEAQRLKIQQQQDYIAQLERSLR